MLFYINKTDNFCFEIRHIMKYCYKMVNISKELIVN